MKSDLHKKAGVKTNILGVQVSSTSLSSVLEKVQEAIKLGTKRPYFIVTAYSESILEAQKNVDFRKALAKADLIVPDGVSLLAAADYLTTRSGMIFSDLVLGLKIGTRIVSGKYQTTRGSDIFKRVLRGTDRIYLSGGWKNVAEVLAQKYPSVVGWDNGDRDVAKINALHPDVLFVALGRFRQEIWIAENLDKLKVKVVIGVGSAFDEVAENWHIPAWIDRMGLKWLWRVLRNPSHFPRALRAAVVFPLTVFLHSSHLSRLGEE